MTTRRLRTDLGTITAAALAAVDPERLVQRRLALVDGSLEVDGRPLTPACLLEAGSRVVVVGGGKAAGAMAAGVVERLMAGGLQASRLTGLVSVPEGSGRMIPGVRVLETRPPGVNLPTERAVHASREILALVGSLGPADVVIGVISGGGSAVLAAPRPGVSLEEKVAVTAFLAAAGADIRELNAVRRAASEIKGGGLARACTSGRLVALVLSDVIGDPLAFIASGPCLPGDDAAAALDVLGRYGAITAGVAPGLVAVLEADRAAATDGRPRLPPTGAALVSPTGSWTTPRGCRVEHVLLGSNATAVEAAAATGQELGYLVSVCHARSALSEAADEVGIRLARVGLALAGASAADGRPRAIIEGGEAVVELPAEPGLGGRNQQTALAALNAMNRERGGWPESLAMASVGTDGEDGPTTAAGGIIDTAVAAAVDHHTLDLETALARCDAYPLLAAADGLIETGPTGTNVADLRIVLARP
jgi:glycerate 2-kinase